VRFPQDDLSHFVLESVTSPNYSGPQIIAIDSQIYLHLKIQNTTFLCIKFPPPILSPRHSTRGQSLGDLVSPLSMALLSLSSWYCVIYINLNPNRYIHILVIDYSFRQPY